MMIFLALGAALGGDCTSTESDPTAVGSGTASDPWRLCTVEQLQGIQSHPTGHFKLVADIDLQRLNRGLGFSCTLFPTVGGFEGSFDGNGHTVSNLRSNRGLFDCINGGLVENLHLEEVVVAGDDYGVGGLVGFMDGGTVDGVTITGELFNDGNGVGGVGGVVYDSVVERVSFDGTISGAGNSGGLIGVAVRSDLADCAAIGSAEASANVGGLVGAWISIGQTSTLRRCVAAVGVSAPEVEADARVGLVVGITVGTVVFGSDGTESWDLVFALESGSTPLLGTEQAPVGASLAAGREVLLDPVSYERAGWDLDDVWTEPTAVSLPLLR